MEINTSSHPYNAASISRSFLNYFESHGYKTIPGSSLLDPSVPMSFVMSAGLVQVERSAARQGGRMHDRYVLLQNCFRYFDLDTIGDSAYHLTLFHMAGAFSFGDVNRINCISNIWDLLARVFGLSPESLWVTYFRGGEVGGHFFEWNLVSVPSLNGLHRTEWLQFDNYLPKIAVDGSHVYVTWTGRDYDDLMSVFVRHSPNYGETFDEAINITRETSNNAMFERMWCEDAVNNPASWFWGREDWSGQVMDAFNITTLGVNTNLFTNFTVKVEGSYIDAHTIGFTIHHYI